MTLVKIETGSGIPPPEGPFRISFSGHISAPDQDIFTKFGEYVGNELSQGVEWSKHVCSKIQFGRRRQCTIHAIYQHFGSVYLSELKICSRTLVGMHTVGSPNVWNGPNAIPSKIQFRGRRPCTTHTTYRRSVVTSSTRSHFFTL